MQRVIIWDEVSPINGVEAELEVLSLKGMKPKE